MMIGTDQEQRTFDLLHLPILPDTSLEPLEVLYIVVSCHAKLLTKRLRAVGV